MRHPVVRRIAIALAVLAAIYGLLLIPEGDPPAPRGADGEPFIWGQDALWETLREEGARVREAGCDTGPVQEEITAGFRDVGAW